MNVAMRSIQTGLRKAAAVLLGSSVMMAAVLTGCGKKSFDDTEQAPAVDVIPFRVDGEMKIFRGEELLATLEIEIADDDSSRTRGMMQRTEFPTNRGMLFIFETEEDRFFWMANTPLSLDLIFIGADSTIMHLAKYMRPLSPQEVPSKGPAQFVLELVAGNADTIGLIEGDRVTWTRSDQE